MKGGNSAEERIRALGLVLPPPIKAPGGVALPFQFVRIVGNRAMISGHAPQNPDGSLAEPLGKLGRELTIEQGYAAARLTGLAILGSLKRAHSRSAIGMAELPFDIPVEIEGEVELTP